MLCSPNTQVMSRASAPSGAYTGIYEVCELRDDDQNRNFRKGIGKALHRINTEIAAAGLHHCRLSGYVPLRGHPNVVIASASDYTYLSTGKHIDGTCPPALL